MTTHERTAGPTKGKAEIKYEFNVMIENRMVAACGGYSSNISDDNAREENVANAELCKEAFDTFYETGITPAQMDKIIGVLEDICLKRLSEINVLQSQLTEARKALEFYAGSLEGGNIARAALKLMGEG